MLALLLCVCVDFSNLHEENCVFFPTEFVMFNRGNSLLLVKREYRPAAALNSETDENVKHNRFLNRKKKNRKSIEKGLSPIKDSSSALTHAQWHSSKHQCGEENGVKMSNIDINWLFLSSLK